MARKAYQMTHKRMKVLALIQHAEERGVYLTLDQITQDASLGHKKSAWRILRDLRRMGVINDVSRSAAKSRNIRLVHDGGAANDGQGNRSVVKEGEAGRYYRLSNGKAVIETA
jgi:Fe2+ or Zn2+ uptake regulation protein